MLLRVTLADVFNKLPSLSHRIYQHICCPTSEPTGGGASTSDRRVRPPSLNSDPVFPFENGTKWAFYARFLVCRN